jgi:hypothetical protein
MYVYIIVLPQIFGTTVCFTKEESSGDSLMIPPELNRLLCQPFEVRRLFLLYLYDLLYS